MDPINQTPVAPQASSNGKIILGVVVVLAIAAVIYFMSATPVTEETVNNTEPAQDTTAVINEEIEKVDIGELDATLDADLKDIDAQLNNL